MELSSDSEIDNSCDVYKGIKRCPCDTAKPRSNYPASIMRDISVCKIKNKFTYNNAVDTDNPLHKVMKQIIYHTSMFNYAEDTYNKNNEYYFGELPYIIEQKIFNFIKARKDINDFVNYIDNEVILPYLNKMYNLDYTNSDFNKIQLLIIFIIMTMSSNSNQDLFNQIMNCYNNLTMYYNINYLYGNNLYNVDLNRDGKFTDANIKNILAIVYNVFSNECNAYNKCSEEYSKCIYDGMESIREDPTCELILSYLGWSDETKTFNVSQIDVYNQKLLMPAQQKFDELYKDCINCYLHAFNKKYIKKINYNTTFHAIAQEDVDTTQIIIKSSSDLYNNILTKSVLKNYFYTSLLMYKRFQLPPIKSNDDGNGRLSEYLLSNVYHNYGIYLYTDCKIDTDSTTPNIIDEYKNIYNNDSTYYMLNIRALCLLYLKYFCRNGIFTKRLLNHEDPECKVVFNQGYNIYADVYNKINIDVDYVLVKLNGDGDVDVEYIHDMFKMLDKRVQAGTDIEILRAIIKIFKQFVIIFAPLRPLTYYYSTMENVNVDRRWFNKNLNIYNDNININNDSGGDLYCAQGDDFYLFDSKRYNNFDDCYKVKTLVQSWMYMNVYWKPLCCIYNNDMTVNHKVGKNFELYKNYYLGFINPLRNDISACTYNSMNMYLNNKNNTYYLDDTCKCKYSTYLKNNYKFVQQKDNDDYLENIKSIQWNVDNYNRNRIQKQINLRSCKPMDLRQLENQYCSNENSPACLMYRELIARKCKNVKPENKNKNITTRIKKNKPVTSRKNIVEDKPAVVDKIQEINDEINKYSKCKNVYKTCKNAVIIMNTKYCSDENSPDCMKYRNIMSSRLNGDLKDSVLQKSYEKYKNEKIRTYNLRKRSSLNINSNMIDMQRSK